MVHRTAQGMAVCSSGIKRKIFFVLTGLECVVDVYMPWRKAYFRFCMPWHVWCKPWSSRAAMVSLTKPMTEVDCRQCRAWLFAVVTKEGIFFWLHGQYRKFFISLFIFCTLQEMEVCFWSFAQTKKELFVGSVVVDVCLHAMEEGILPAIAKEDGRYFLWEYYVLTTDQWARTCALLQHHQLPPSLLWTLQTRVYYTWRSASETCLVSDVPDAMAALSRMEFLWEDLDAVETWVYFTHVKWVAAEVAKRRQWLTGLRRTWLVAVVGLKKSS